MRNVFKQYQQPENRLTHALAYSLSEDQRLLRRFVRWVTGGPPPTAKLRVLEQQRPGEPERGEKDSIGIPDAWIFTDDGWVLLIESKVMARLDLGQLSRHKASAVRRGFPRPITLALTSRAQSVPNDVVHRSWTQVYSWLRKERVHSEWATRCASYMEILESDLIEEGYLTEGTLTSFAGISFNSQNPYNYLEAKRLLGLALNDLRSKTRLKRELGVDLAAPGRGAITGREGDSVWDFLRLREAKGAFTKYPHMTVAIEHDRAIAIVTVPNGIKPVFRRKLLDLGEEGFSDLMEEINLNILRALGPDKGASPFIVSVQRRYMTQRSPAIVDARIEFDLRTAFRRAEKRRGTAVKQQPQWLAATFQALARKRSNFQVAVGARFPYGRSSSVGEAMFVDCVADVWVACRPLIKAMGIR